LRINSRFRCFLPPKKGCLYLKKRSERERERKANKRLTFLNEKKRRKGGASFSQLISLLLHLQKKQDLVEKRFVGLTEICKTIE